MRIQTNFNPVYIVLESLEDVRDLSSIIEAGVYPCRNSERLMLKRGTLLKELDDIGSKAND